MPGEYDYYQVSQKLLLKNSDGNVLLLKALSKDTYAGFYDLPGGRVDADEFTVPLAESLRREISEEIGPVQYKLNPVPVAIGRHLIPAEISSSHEDKHVLYVLYEAMYISGDIVISHEHTGYEWLDLTALPLEKYLKSGNLEVVRMYLARG